MKPNLLLGDCAEKMRDLADNSIDAIVTDPPYGLAFMGAKWDNFGGKSCGNDSAEVRRQKAQEYAAKNSGAPRYANGHSGAPTLDAMRSFQSVMTPIFAEALRVAKPGAHLLAFGGTRTYHRLACAIEDAGWEIRDCIMWVYGSGFPKSMDVAKAIDKASGYEGEVIGSRVVDVGMQGGNMHAGRKQQQQQQQIRALSPEAAVWQGWGTCLKPAVEPIIVARKPLDGTVAANVLKHGTGAINIDACRVPTENESVSNHSRSAEAAVSKGKYGDSTAQETHQTAGQRLGRFPANLIHDGSDEVLALFPDSKGQCGAVRGTEPSEITNGIYGKYNARLTAEPRGDTGSAARFFYCAKASRAERGSFNDHMTVKPLALMRYLVRLVTRPGGLVLDPFMGSGTTGVAAIQEGINFIGIERDPHYYEIASRRVNTANPTTPTIIQLKLPHENHYLDSRAARQPRRNHPAPRHEVQELRHANHPVIWPQARRRNQGVGEEGGSMNLEEFSSYIRESESKWLAELVGKLDEELVERIEFLGSLGPTFPRALPTELKGIAV